VTENGIPQAEDHQRGAFIVAHLTELLRAIRDGVEIPGYLYWTLADNWEWHEGYRPQARFGLYTVDRSDPTMPRHLTDGAHALAYAISRRDLRGARNLFGTISSNGDRILPPRRSPAFLTGTLDGQPVSLMIRVDPDGWIRGVLAEPSVGRTLPLIGTFDATLGTLTLQHFPGPGVGWGMFTGQRSGTEPLAYTGTLERDGAAVPWAIIRDGLVGEWIGEGALPRVRITHPPGDVSGWAGAWLPDQRPRGWIPLSVSVNGPTVTLEGSGRRATATRTGSTLTGDVTMLLSTQPWAAVRVDDGMPP